MTASPLDSPGPIAPAVRNAPNTRHPVAGYFMCTAWRSDGVTPCTGSAVTGHDKCFKHAGKSRERLRAETAAAIEYAAPFAVRKQLELIADPETPHAVVAKVAKDIVEASGFAAASKVDLTVTSLGTPEERVAEALRIRAELAGGGEGGE